LLALLGSATIVVVSRIRVKPNGSGIHKTAVSYCEHAMQIANVHGAQRCSDLALLCTEYTAAKYASLKYTARFFFTIS
jgi:hypothetical protein